MIVVPRSWSDVTVEQFIEIIELFNEEFTSNYLLKLNLLALFNDTSIDDEIFEDLFIEDLTEYMDSITWLFELPPNKFINKINIDDDDFVYKTFEKLTFGEFIDLNKYFTDFHNNFTKICSVFYRRNHKDEWGNILIEPYTFDIEERKLIFNNQPIGNLYGIVNEYRVMKDKITEIYPIIFGDNEELTDTEGLTEQEIMEIKKEEEEEKKKSVWSWHRIIHRLANGDITKYDEVTNTPLLMVLNDLSMRSICELE